MYLIQSIIFSKTILENYRDKINVSYRLKMLGISKKVRKKNKAKGKEILNLIAAKANLTSKRELIERFILENLTRIEDTETVLQEFEKYWDEEQPKAFNILIKEKNLEKTKMPKLIEDHLFAGIKPLIIRVLNLID